MKKSILFYLLCVLACLQNSAYAQILKSVELSAKKGFEFFPIGESGEFLYYCNLQYTRDNDVKIFIEKFKTSTLDFVETKEISPKDFIPEDVAKGKKIENVNVLFQNQEFHITFSLSNREETSIYAKVIDEKFNNEKNIEIGAFKGLKKGGLNTLEFTYSNDRSKLLFVLKQSFSKATKAIGGAFEKTYQISFLAYDLASNKPLFTKKLPEELKGLTLNSEDYIIDNRGNIFFLAKLSEKRDDLDVLREISIGLFEANKQECSFKQIDLSGFTSLRPNLAYLKNDDILFTGNAGEKSKLMYVSLSDPKLNYEKTQTFSTNSKPETYLELKDMALFKNEIYFTFQEKPLKDYNYISRIFVVNLSLAGNIIWEKDICTKISSYYNDRVRLHLPVDDSGKLNILYKENIKDDKARNKVYESVMATIDRNGRVTRQTVDTDEGIFLSGGSCITTANSEVVFLIKPYTGKKITLKKASFN